MEEACSDDSFNLPPPEAPERREEEKVSGVAILEQFGTVSTSTTAAKSEEPASTVILPNHSVLPLNDQEMQEHRDAILQQQMLGRQLLSKLNRQHSSRQNLQQEWKGCVQEVFPAGFLPEKDVTSTCT